MSDQVLVAIIAAVAAVVVPTILRGLVLLSRRIAAATREATREAIAESAAHVLVPRLDRLADQQAKNTGRLDDIDGRLESIETRTEALEELRPNGGTSMHDRVERIDRHTS